MPKIFEFCGRAHCDTDHIRLTESHAPTIWGRVDTYHEGG